ncbi:hypothetical protein [Lactiplantibacillus fabifermentans]|uniref:Uncharacterized protein n=2 Tax=Lactiplantibacillus fabifermentans TaxID=483011 RepID=A0A0R2P0H0_9LACO|nr:hypothetical protein [Lactiplantibacillus fabifermentans]ETY73666.1 hypothetical protein LFAB_11440 [Lactiplantibacillus fabifermentans T30PCM01]KRO29155.1 hypothetical protein DY78_GL001320 [Lactiplantibacillus fabifermentans DSM 21115]
MTDYSALLGPDRYDIAVRLSTQYHLDPSQVLFGYLQVVSEVTGGDHATKGALDDPKVMAVINEQFEHFLKRRH